MNSTTVLQAKSDPMGQAISDFYTMGKAARLRVFSSLFEEDEIPVSQLFRTIEEMPALEQEALKMAKGRILDVGAGSGCHTLALQDMGKDVVAIDISPLSVETMKKRGVQACYLSNLFDERFGETFDTILMLMNGSGIVGRLDNLPQFFKRMKQMLRPNGRILMDSSDLRYIFEEEDGSFLVNLADKYYGEVDFQMQYKSVRGDSFDWLYIDFETLSYHANLNGFQTRLVRMGMHYDYLAELTLL